MLVIFCSLQALLLWRDAHPSSTMSSLVTRAHTHTHTRMHTALLSSYGGEELEKAEAAYSTLIRHFSSVSRKGEGQEISPTPFQFPSHGYQLFSHSSPMITDEPTTPDSEGHLTDLKLLRKTSVPSRHFEHSPSTEQSGSYSPEASPGARPGSPHDPSRPRKTTPSEAKERSRRRRQRESASEASFASSPSGQSLASVSSIDQPASKPGLIKLYMTDMQPGGRGRGRGGTTCRNRWGGQSVRWRQY